MNGRRSGHNRSSYLHKEKHSQKCQNYRTISLISHPSKVMLRVFLNRLKAKAEELLAEEKQVSDQAGAQ